MTDKNLPFTKEELDAIIDKSADRLKSKQLSV